jgi:hypothetical protein
VLGTKTGNTGGVSDTGVLGTRFGGGELAATGLGMSLSGLLWLCLGLMLLGVAAMLVSGRLEGWRSRR